VQPTPPFSTAVQPIPPPVALPPTIPDDHHGYVTGDERPVDGRHRRRARRRALFARVLGVLGILFTLALAFMTVGRAWLRSFPSVTWPALLKSPDQRELPAPVAPSNEPVLPSPPREPLIVPPHEATPGASSLESEPTLTEPSAADATPTEPTAKEAAPPEPSVKESATPSSRRVQGRRTEPTRATPREQSDVTPKLSEPPMPLEDTSDRPMTPDELPGPPSVDPAAPESPPAGEANQVPPDEGNQLFSSE
jgi:hypothetical protein